jgi:hypothetical protein
MNRTFSLTRAGLLIRQYFYLYGKNVLISIAAATAIVFVLNAFLFSINYSMSKYDQFDLFFSMVFLFALGGAAILWTGQAFPPFRSGIGTHNYLLTPASHLEKLVVEILLRIGLLLLIFPLIYWVATNFAMLVMSIVPEYDLYGFSFQLPEESLPIRDYALFISLGMMVPVIVFTGSTYFRKLPSVKTIAVVFMVVVVWWALIYFVMEIIGFKNYYKDDGSLMFIDRENAKIITIVTTWVINIYLIVISYFKLKEKEV